MERWENVEAVQRMQDYIGAHLCEPITLRQLASAAGYSPWHSARIFHELMGRTPFDYIRALRLTQAALALRGGDRRVLDVALDFVFDSHEGFTRAFTRQFGIPPGRYGRSAPPIPLFMPSRIRETYLTMNREENNMAQNQPQENAGTIFVQVIDRPARKALILRGVAATHYFEYCEEVGCDVWGVLSSVKEALMSPLACGCRKNSSAPARACIFRA